MSTPVMARVTTGGQERCIRLAITCVEFGGLLALAASSRQSHAPNVLLMGAGVTLQIHNARVSVLSFSNMKSGCPKQAQRGPSRRTHMLWKQLSG